VLIHTADRQRAAWRSARLQEDKPHFKNSGKWPVASDEHDHNTEPAWLFAACPFPFDFFFLVLPVFHSSFVVAKPRSFLVTRHLSLLFCLLPFAF
jgi:hypothetical protein